MLLSALMDIRLFFIREQDYIRLWTQSSSRSASKANDTRLGASARKEVFPELRNSSTVSTGVPERLWRPANALNVVAPRFLSPVSTA
jgi:hypothetical protein